MELPFYPPISSLSTCGAPLNLFSRRSLSLSFVALSLIDCRMIKGDQKYSRHTHIHTPKKKKKKRVRSERATKPLRDYIEEGVTSSQHYTMRVRGNLDWESQKEEKRAPISLTIFSLSLRSFTCSSFRNLDCYHRSLQPPFFFILYPTLSLEENKKKVGLLSSISFISVILFFLSSIRSA